MIAKAENNIEGLDKWSQKKEKKQREADKVNGTLNEFKKKEAFGESYPQVILQLAIILKNQ